MIHLTRRVVLHSATPKKGECAAIDSQINKEHDLPNTRRALLKARLDWVRRDLNKILDRLTPDLLEWAPAEGMRTVAGQIVEILEIEIPLVARLTTVTGVPREISDAELAEIIGDCGNMAHLREILNEVRQRTLDCLETFSESDLAEEVSYGSIWFGSMWMSTLPRAELFLNISDHELYHVGQLTSYLWARGDNPYQW